MASFRPLHDRVLVRRIEAEEKTRGGIIIPDTAQEKPVEGEVLHGLDKFALNWWKCTDGYQPLTSKAPATLFPKICRLLTCIIAHAV